MIEVTGGGGAGAFSVRKIDLFNHSSIVLILRFAFLHSSSFFFALLFTHEKRLQSFGTSPVLGYAFSRHFFFEIIVLNTAAAACELICVLI